MFFLTTWVLFLWWFALLLDETAEFFFRVKALLFASCYFNWIESKILWLDYGRPLAGRNDFEEFLRIITSFYPLVDPPFYVPCLYCKSYYYDCVFYLYSLVALTARYNPLWADIPYEFEFFAVFGRLNYGGTC